MVAGVNHGAAADCTEDMLKTNTSALAPVLAALALTAGCSDLQDDAVLAHAAEDARLVDLQNRFVMPGMVDAHTHPGLIATGANVSVLDETDEADEEPANADRMPSRPREATLAWLQRQRSDDLFMFFKRPIAGLSPGGRYIVTVSVEIATDAPAARSGKVYPRGGGGAVEVRRAFVEVLGSIPACAGKPEAPRRLQDCRSVHPRVCGEASAILLTVLRPFSCQRAAAF